MSRGRGGWRLEMGPDAERGDVTRKWKVMDREETVLEEKQECGVENGERWRWSTTTAERQDGDWRRQNGTQEDVRVEEIEG